MDRNKSKKYISRNTYKEKSKKKVPVKKIQRKSPPKKSPNISKLIKRKAVKKVVRKTLRDNKKTKKPTKSLFSRIFNVDKEKKPDKILLFLVIFLVLTGLLMVLDTSLVFAKRDFHNAYHFLILQAGAAVVGFVGFFAAYYVDYKIIKKLVFWLFLATIALLASTLFTHEVNGARSWISLGGLNLQPSEIAKLTFVLYIAGIVSAERKWHTLNEFIKEDFLPFALPLGAILLFVLGGKDLGTSLIIGAIALIIYFFKSKTKYEYVALGIMLVMSFVLVIGMISLESYRNDRVRVYSNLLVSGTISDKDKEGAGYQMKQVLLALGTGGWTGVGLAESLQKYDLVETTAATDSVIAIIAEEFGFVGAITVLAVFLLYIYRGLRITTYHTDKYGQIVAVGLVSWIGMQMFIHVASNTVVTPLTGVPMPFLSYGGSSLVSCMVASGILLNISRH